MPLLTLPPLVTLTLITVPHFPLPLHSTHSPSPLLGFTLLSLLFRALVPLNSSLVPFPRRGRRRSPSSSLRRGSLLLPPPSM